MNSIRTLVTSISFLLLIFFLCAASVQGNEPTLKVMNWNIGGKYDLTGAQRIDRMKKLAEVIKSHQIDVVYFQEFYGKANDKEVLLAELQALQYPMYFDSEPYDKKNLGHLVILSKYPLDLSSRKIAQIRGNRIVYSVIAKDTPLGWVRLSNFHTHIAEPCKNMMDALNFFEKLDFQRTILSGDANITFSTFSGIPENLTRKDCKGYDWGKISNLCRDATFNCKPNDVACRNNSSCFGDYVYLPNPSELVLITNRSIGNAYGISDQHPAIVAVVGSKIIPISPKQGDLDSDGDVDIFDLNQLVQKYGTTGAPGFHTADIIQNGVVDIFDYNKLVESFGK